MKIQKKIAIISLSLLIISGVFIIGCSMFDNEKTSPTTPGTALSLANYWGSRSHMQDIQVFVGREGTSLLSVNIPSPGSETRQGYELVYDVVKSGTNTVSSFIVDFEVTDATILCIGLETDDVLAAATLYEADFSGQTPLLIQGTLRLFGFPGGWHGWDGPTPPPTVPPIAVSSSGILLYANGEAHVPAMEENYCKVEVFVPAPGIIGKCDELTVAGSDTPETHHVEMGQNAGTFQFDYETYFIPDQMIVEYEGTTLFDTGCVGGSGAKAISYAGSSTRITVKVIPNCAGTFGTAWQFFVACPSVSTMQ